MVGAYGRDDGRQTDTSLNSYVKATRRGQTPYYYTSVGEVPLATIHIYPNPATDQLHISYPDIQGEATLTLRDIMGRKVWSQPVIKAQSDYAIVALPSGIYLYQVRDRRGTLASGRITKE